MDHKSLIVELKSMAELQASEMGLEVVAVRSKKSGGNHIVEVLLYREGGLSLDDCADFSRAFGDSMEEKNIIDSKYSLEVGSPGLDWPIKTDDDLRRVVGKKLEAKLYSAVDGKKMIVGELQSYDEQTVILSSDGIEVSIERDKIARLTQAIFI
ncbi:MAG: ribosome maturation factor RimP [Tissierellia bacterium]|nr:ribosome maturation factor RimP [Tissierellia bacterium]